MCNAPVSSNCIITVTWSYIHTGGLPLTNVSVFTEDSTIAINPIQVESIDTTSVEVPDLVAGFEYTFNITTENNGSSSILCGPTLHRVGELMNQLLLLMCIRVTISINTIGRPATPLFGALTSGPGTGEVTITIKTMASGLNDPSQVFWFVITPYTDSTEGETIPHLIRNYSQCFDHARLHVRKRKP